MFRRAELRIRHESDALNALAAGCHHQFAIQNALDVELPFDRQIRRIDFEDRLRPLDRDVEQAGGRVHGDALEVHSDRS